jgi:hypothetical protein
MLLKYAIKNGKDGKYNILWLAWYLISSEGGPKSCKVESFYAEPIQMVA